MKWEPYEDDGTLLVDSSYEIQYRPAGRDPGAIQNRTVSGTSDLSIIEGITDAQNYEVCGFLVKMLFFFLLLFFSPQCSPLHRLVPSIE